MPSHLGCRRCRPYLICAKSKSTSEDHNNKEKTNGPSRGSDKIIYKIGPPIPSCGRRDEVRPWSSVMAQRPAGDAHHVRLTILK